MDPPRSEGSLPTVFVIPESPAALRVRRLQGARTPAPDLGNIPAATAISRQSRRTELTPSLTGDRVAYNAYDVIGRFLGWFPGHTFAEAAPREVRTFCAMLAYTGCRITFARLAAVVALTFAESVSHDVVRPNNPPHWHRHLTLQMSQYLLRALFRRKAELRPSFRSGPSFPYLHIRQCRILVNEMYEPGSLPIPGPGQLTGGSP
jgi:hypothetical protein